MPRPRKCRKVCCMPGSTLYGPLNGFSGEQEYIVMTVEEYETIRLIDLEGFNQEECAEKMQVARATVQNIYKTARLKISDSLVNGRILKIEGGDFQLYEDKEQGCGCPRCGRKMGATDGE
jgi:predicted DNA-binding protein (UPF0251 family)